MLKVIKGNNSIEIPKEELLNLVSSYEKTTVDLGTGDGRFVYKNAKKNPNHLYLGIDPSEKQLKIYSKKANREKLSNVLFILGSLDNLPAELIGVSDEVVIYFPWGSLLEGIAAPNKEGLKRIAGLIKPNGSLSITFGYSAESEPTEVQRLGLEKLDNNAISNSIAPVFREVGLEMTEMEVLKRADFAKTGTTWGKRLFFGQNRPGFKLTFKKADLQNKY